MLCRYEDQSIYSWRGACISNILDFKKRFPNAKIVRLKKNYRSSSNIVSLAMSVISNNLSRYDKTIESVAGKGEKIEISLHHTDRDEMNNIATKIENLVEDGFNLNKVAILVRSNFLNRSIENIFLRRMIKYRVLDGIKFFDRKEVKDIISYLRLVFSPSDAIAFSRAINNPKRGVGEKTMQSIQKYSLEKYLNITDGLSEMIKENLVKPSLKEKLDIFVEQIKKWQKKAYDNSMSIAELAEEIAHETGYMESLKDNEDKKEVEARTQNIEDFFKTLEDFENLQDFLEHVALVNTKDQDENNNAVNILTMHGSKGLEYDVVFCPAWEEGIFPSGKSIESGENEIEEERRLAYVAMTRAKKILFISSAKERFSFNIVKSGNKSRFINEMLKQDNKESITYIDKTLTDNRGYMQNNHYRNKAGYDINYKQRSQDALSKRVTANTERSRSSVNNGGLKRKNNLDNNINDFKQEDEVMHCTFGKGKVVKMMGHYIEVFFEDTKERKLIHHNFIKMAVKNKTT